jgi:hypothetical protein
MKHLRIVAEERGRERRKRERERDSEREEKEIVREIG